MRSDVVVALCAGAMVLTACSRPAAPGGPGGDVSSTARSSASSSTPLTPSSVAAGARAPSSPPTPAGAQGCDDQSPAGAPSCLRFATAEDAFTFVLAHDPAILAIGEAHAQKGTEKIPSTTKRFTEQLLPIVAPRATDLFLEAWAPDARCQQAVKQVASAQKPVTQTQAASNPNEYVTLGTRAKELGVKPALLRPTCDDFAAIADAGADAITVSLGTIKRVTQAQATDAYRRNEAAKNAKIVIAYGGAAHNDLAPSGPLGAYSFGPALAELTGGRYIELDIIVPEYIQDNAVWQKLAWIPAWRASPGPKDKATLFRQGTGSFVLVLPSAK